MENVTHNNAQFLRDIFIGICHTLTINKEFSIENMKVRKKDCSDKQRFMIRKNHIKFEDDIVKKLGKEKN